MENFAGSVAIRRPRRNETAGTKGGTACPRHDPPASMAIRFQRKHHTGERVAGRPLKRYPRIARTFLAASDAGPHARRRADVRHRLLGIAVDGPPAAIPCLDRAARGLAALFIVASSARFIQADAQARIAGAALLPSLSGTGQETYSRTSGSSASGLSIGGREVVNYTSSLSASYELDFWGKNRDATQAAEETAIANRFDRDVVALTTLTSVANAYFQVLASQDRIRTAQNNIASATRILEAIKQRFKAGTGTDLDVAQQEAVLANQKALVPPLRQTLALNINALATLVSRPPESIRVSGGSLNQIASPRVTPGLPSELLTQRPDIRRQEAQLASATANVGNARAQFFPSIQLTGQGGYQSSALVSLFQPHAAFFNVVGSLTQPIFDGGRILGNFEFTKARQDELLQTYRKTVVSAFADVDNALVSIRQTSEKLRLQREVLAASRRAFQLSEQQLRAGAADGEAGRCSLSRN